MSRPGSLEDQTSEKKRNLLGRIYDCGKYPVATGLFLALAFPPFDLFLFAWMALVPLLLHISRSEGWKRAFSGGFWALALFYGLHLSWLPRSIEAYGGMSSSLSWGVYLLACAFLGLFGGGFAVVTYICWRRWAWRGFFLTPVLWVCMEFAREHLAFGGFLWGSLAASQAWYPYLVQMADLTGAYGVSCLIVLVNTSFLLVLAPGVERKLKSGWTGLVAIAMVYAFLYGEIRYTTFPVTAGQALKVGCIQGNIREEWGAADIARFQMKEYPALLDKLLKENPGTSLVLFPENPTPLSWERHPGYRDLQSSMARSHKVTILFNGLRHGDSAVYNSIYSVGPNGNLASIYDKGKLVPFAERVPLFGFFGLARAFSQEVGDFTPGSGAQPLATPAAKLGVFVCYESVFPDYVRQFSSRGAQLLVNVTNDAWFGPTAATYQHLQHAILRAVENRR